MGKHRSRSRSRSKSRSRSTSSSSSDRDTDSNKWNGESGYRIHISDLAVGTSRREIEKVFTKYGPINEVWVASNPPCFAFVNFKHRSDAEQAIREVDRKVIGSTRVGVSWARTRTFGGRHRGGRGYASSSYRSSAGGGGRRRSRSRSRSNSRHRRRRSHSRDRHRRRSITPKKRTKSKSRSSSPRRSRSRSSSAVKQKTTNRINESNNNRSPIATAGD